MYLEQLNEGIQAPSWPAAAGKWLADFFYEDLTPLFLHLLSAHHTVTLSWCSTLLCAL